METIYRADDCTIRIVVTGAFCMGSINDLSLWLNHLPYWLLFAALVLVLGCRQCSLQAAVTAKTLRALVAALITCCHYQMCRQVHMFLSQKMLSPTVSWSVVRMFNSLALLLVGQASFSAFTVHDFLSS